MQAATDAIGVAAGAVRRRAGTQEVRMSNGRSAASALLGGVFRGDLLRLEPLEKDVDRRKEQIVEVTRNATRILTAECRGALQRKRATGE